MLRVKTTEEVMALIEAEFQPLTKTEITAACSAVGRVLAEDVRSEEFVPDFDRSTVDGYAVRASDTFGCSDSMPAILRCSGEVLMGEGAASALQPDCCVYVPTGGAVPEGADACVMLEYTESYGDGSIGILKPAAPADNMIFRGDDVYPDKTVLKSGRLLSSQDIGALSAIGRTEVSVKCRVRLGIISTGDELVPPEAKPQAGQVRNVNSPMLAAMMTALGAEVKDYGIVRDDEALLRETMHRAISDCDAVLVSGGSSVGVKDAVCRVIEGCGELLFHGIAMKPGKPTMLGKCSGKPVLGLPGHPVAAFFAAKLFAAAVIRRLEGKGFTPRTVQAMLSESVGANHGRAQYGCVRLENRGGTLYAVPIRSKSGLITTLAGADGYYCIERDCEGLPQGAEISIVLCEGD